MKIFVDDIRNAPDDKWYTARTVVEAIRAIYYHRNIIKEISLDHDISHQIGMGELSRPYPCAETYAAVAYYIAEVYGLRAQIKKSGIKAACLSIDCPERTGGECWEANVPKIVLHTSNLVGAENMQLILSNAGIDCVIEMRGAANRLEMELK